MKKKRGVCISKQKGKKKQPMSVVTVQPIDVEAVEIDPETKQQWKAELLEFPALEEHNKEENKRKKCFSARTLTVQLSWMRIQTMLYLLVVLLLVQFYYQERRFDSKVPHIIMITFFDCIEEYDAAKELNPEYQDPEYFNTQLFAMIAKNNPLSHKGNKTQMKQKIKEYCCVLVQNIREETPKMRQKRV